MSAPLRIVLSYVPNPDVRNGGYWEGVPTEAPRQVVEVASLRAASEALRSWVERNGLGGGNMEFECGNVLDASGKVVANVSYNGRVWEPGAVGKKEIEL